MSCEEENKRWESIRGIVGDGITEDIKSLNSFRAHHGTYVPGESKVLRDKILEAAMDNMYDQFEIIREEVKFYVDIWFDEFKKIYSVNKDIISFKEITCEERNITRVIYNIDDFYNSVISYKVNQIINKHETSSNYIPCICLVVRRKEDILIELIKINKDFIYSYTTNKTKWFKTTKIKHLEEKDRVIMGEKKKAFIPYLRKQLKYFNEQKYDFTIKPPKLNFEARFIREGNETLSLYNKFIKNKEEYGE